MKFLLFIFISLSVSTLLWAGGTSTTSENDNEESTRKEISVKSHWVTCVSPEVSDTSEKSSNACREINLNHVAFIKVDTFQNHTTFYFPAISEGGAMKTMCFNDHIEKGRHCSISETLDLQ